MARSQASHAGWDWLVLLTLPVLLHAPELLGWWKSDPRLLLSGLGIGVRPGWAGGHGGFLDPNSAWTAQALGHAAAEQWLSGRVPWWNPFIGVGAPLAAEMQPAALFLPFVLLMHFGQGWLWLHMLLQMIAATGAYALLRRLELGRGACLAGAVLYGCNGTLAWFSHGPERVAAFLPWLLVGVEGCRTGRAGGVVFAVALTLSIYAGFPETAYLDGLLALTWAGLRGWQSARRGRYAGRLIGGGLAGLLLSAPAIVPFVEFLMVADTGVHTRMATAHLSPPGIAMLLLPYLSAPVDARGRPMIDLWGSVGGYLGVAATFLALLGALGRRHERGLRLLLTGWLVFWIARAAGVGPVMWVSNLAPLIAQTAVHRYIVPTLAMVAAALAGFAIDDWCRGPAARRVVVAGVATLLLCGVAGVGCRPQDPALSWGLLGRVFWACSILWAVVVTLGLGWLMSRRGGRAVGVALAALVCADAGGMYLLARAGSPLAGRIDVGPAAFLQANAGSARVISLRGGLFPNETAWHGFAGIDETMLPVPRLWADYVRGRLGGDPVSFLHVDVGIDRLARDWPAYRALGAGWLLCGAGWGPGNAWASEEASEERQPLALDRGAVRVGDLPQGLPGDQLVRSVGVDIGTYGGLSDGMLRLSLNGGSGAASGTAELSGAADNAPVDFLLDRPLPAGRPLHWELRKIGGSRPVAVWLYGAGGAPRFSVAGHWPGFSPALAYANAHMQIYALPGAAPYMQADGCASHPASRTMVQTDCAAAGSLLRRELFFPGWTATVNGAAVAVRQDGLFQRVAVPAGRAEVRFAYAPPGILWAYAAGVAGVLLTVLLGWPSRPAGRPMDC